MLDADRPLTDDERARVSAARAKIHTLYDGVRTPHRSCGIAMAETFGLPTRSYQALRRGGLTGAGPCGVALGGRLVLGEILGDPDPSGPPTDRLRQAIALYDRLLPARMGLAPGASTVCDDLTRPHGDFRGPARHGFCTGLATDVGELVAEVLVRAGWDGEITPIPGLDVTG